VTTRGLPVDVPLPGMERITGMPTLAELRAELVDALRSAGVQIGHAADPHTGPGAEVGLVDAEWETFRVACGDPATATYTTVITVFGYGSNTDHADAVDAVADTVWAALPLPWRVTRLDHSRSTAEQFVRTIEVER
jgi:hypothetical protein